VAVALLGFLVAAAAAVAGRASHRQPLSGSVLLPPPTSPSAARSQADLRGAPPKSWHLHVPWWLVERLLALLLALAVVLVILLIVRWVPRLERRRFRAARDGEPEYAPELPSQQLAHAVTAAVDDALARYRQGDRERAVIACWIRLEQIAERAGFGRGRAETSSELAARWQSQLPVSPEPLLALADLYRRARYSSHPVPESAIETARGALERLRREITAGARPA